MIQEKLRNLRKQKGLSQVMMAKILSTDTSNYSRKERGETRIHDDEWRKLANALEVPVEMIKENDNNFTSLHDKQTSKDSETEGNVNYYMPGFVIDSLREYIILLKEENNVLKSKLEELKTKIR
ncbi:helix-turn-helix transcriptional regulator [Chryseobacterium sp. L7]|uniref:Helix-turn-helix transcriptional regulator n=1 Tax=Chryseobacterium endalhagicum TaxID=2797638 RepID=A0ABS1QI54_9FLAO|nr:helix-turn-helix transcriptional regulator [Chryseobacterium endalhagicum]MBL1222289.1 helix-turn-helix transcriptional regulator [Chryseobacterium endalhagicum]